LDNKISWLKRFWAAILIAAFLITSNNAILTENPYKQPSKLF